MVPDCLNPQQKKTKKQTKGSRLLEPNSSNKKRLQQSDDQKNIYDKILENVNTFLAPVIIKGDYILVLFDLSTKYLNIIDLSFVNKLFVLFKQKIQSFIEDHNILIRSKIREGIDLAFSITEPLFILIINFMDPFYCCFLLQEPIN